MEHEETGWSLGRVAILGFTHVRHLDPRPPGYDDPYPDFCWLVYAAEAAEFSPEAKLDDGHEIGTAFLPVAPVRALALTQSERVYLDAALSVDETTW